jgi:fructokinase
VKLSVEDACWLGGFTPDNALEGVREWVGKGPAAAVITKGAQGLLAITGGGDVVEVPAAPAQVVDTIGAGDTVHGALLYWLSRAGITDRDGLRTLTVDAWREALVFAAKAAAVTVSRAGAEPPFLAELV